MGVFLVGALVVWIAVVIVVLAACRAAAQADVALLAPARPRACESRRRRVLRRVLTRAQ